jgi:sugar phosphate isomerase/epimerase
MTAPKKSPAQIDREIAEVLAARAAERRAPTTASGVVRKQLGRARSIAARLRDDGRLRDEGRAIKLLEALGADAIAAAESAIAEARLPVGYESIWASRLADVVGHARRHVADLRGLRSDPAGYARTARQRFSADTSPDLATALHYVSALDDLVRALRRIEAMTRRAD